MLRGLTREQYHHLASVFNQACVHGVIPSQWGITSVAMLPKKPTVERPIGLMHVCAKAMLKSRWHLIEEWNHHFQLLAPWDQARVGVSAIEVGAARLLRTEVHAAHDMHGVTLFVDLSTFFESVDHARLIQVADEVGFPPLLLELSLRLYPALPGSPRDPGRRHGGTATIPHPRHNSGLPHGALAQQSRPV